MVPATVIELVLGSFFSFGSIVDVFLYVALVEELIKFIAVRIKAYSSPHFSEVMDGIVYTVAAGLGFATAENIIYVLENGLSVAIVRAFLSVPDHAVWAGIMGFYIGLAKFRSVSINQQRMRIIEGIGIAVILHGVYDITVFSGALLEAIGVSFFGWVLFLLLIRKALSLSPFRWRETGAIPTYGTSPLIPYSPRFCTQCGSRLSGNEKYCMHCGFQVTR